MKKPTEPLEQIPLEALGLSDDEMGLLEALVAGSGQTLLNKLFRDALVAYYGQMDRATDMQSVFRLQGQILGVRYAMNAPLMLVKQWRAQKDKKPSKEMRL